MFTALIRYLLNLFLSSERLAFIDYLPIEFIRVMGLKCKATLIFAINRITIIHSTADLNSFANPLCSLPSNGHFKRT